MAHTNPIEYLQALGVKEIFRFILTHPHMDHLDGFDNLINNVRVLNFWDAGVRPDKPDFDGNYYDEADWDRYIKVRDGNQKGVTVVNAREGSKFKYANKNEDGSFGADGLHIVAPNKELVGEANWLQDFNDASYIISYRSANGTIIIPGDAHDEAWECAIESHRGTIEDCLFLLAPHHGRRSDASFEFLNVIRPVLSLLGNAPSKDLAYDAWSNRRLPYITQHQSGNVVLEVDESGVNVFVENDKLVEHVHGNHFGTNDQGYSLLFTLQQPAAVA